MPRDGSGNYTLPYPAVVDGTTIESAVHNGTMSDIALQLNGPVPIVAGGTGANNAHDAMIALSGEIALQNVTNYDTFPFVAGSFYSAPGATSAPDGTSGFAGICYVYGDPTFLAIEARNLSIPSGPLWVRQKIAGVWGAWVQQSGSVADLDARYVNIGGDTMTGALSLASTNPRFQLDGAIGYDNDFYGLKGGSPRWLMRIGNSEAETGGNAGSNFNLYSWTDAGAVLSLALSINRATGLMTVGGGLSAIGGFYANQMAKAVNIGTPQGINAALNVRFDPGAYSGIELSSSSTGTGGVIFGVLNNANTMWGWTWAASQAAIDVSGQWNYTSGLTAPTPTAGDNSTKVATTAFVAAAAGAKVVRVQKFTASGTYTPDANLLFAQLITVGGGGGSGSSTGATGYFTSGGGGGGGSTSEKWVTAATIGASQTVTIGAAGSAGANGGNTSIGSLCTANGGALGTSGTSGTIGIGGAGGAAGVGDVTVPGQAGSNGIYMQLGTVPLFVFLGGQGGSSRCGFGAQGAAAGGGASVAGVIPPSGSYGGGAAGAASNNVASGGSGVAAAPGVAFVIEYCKQ